MRGGILGAPEEGCRLYEYICEHVVDGCDHKDRDESRETLMERVRAHLSDYHKLDPDVDPIAETLKKTGVVFIQPM